MENIRRDGILIRIPPDITSAGGDAVAQYVAAVPAECFPPVPPDLRAPDAGPALDAYLAELERLGTLAPFQALADTRFAQDMKVLAERTAADRAKATQTPATVSEAALEKARAAAQRTTQQLAKAPSPAAPATSTPATKED